MARSTAGWGTALWERTRLLIEMLFERGHFEAYLRHFVKWLNLSNSCMFNLQLPYESWLWKSFLIRGKSFLFFHEYWIFPGTISVGIHLGLHYCPGKCADVATENNKWVLQRGWVAVIHIIITICRQIIIFFCGGRVIHCLICFVTPFPLAKNNNLKHINR